MQSNYVEVHLKNAVAALQSLDSQRDALEKIAQEMVRCSRSGGTIYSAGNGGSTCDAIHLTEELVARYLRDRPGIRAAHLCDAAVLTCWSNDRSFETVFERQVRTQLTSKDLLVVFSTSGNSPNVLRALEAANEIGATTVAFLGKGGGKAATLATLPIIVGSQVTAHIQEAHVACVHILCELVETTLFPHAVR